MYVKECNATIIRKYHVSLHVSLYDNIADNTRILWHVAHKCRRLKHDNESVQRSRLQTSVGYVTDVYFLLPF